MEEKKYRVVWTKISRKQLKEAYHYMIRHSPKSAIKVLEEITSAVSSTVNAPKKYPPDKYKLLNDGSYRAF